MGMRLRQVALVARDLESSVAALCAQLGLSVCFRDPGVAYFGLHNALMPVGDTFLEVVSPLRAGTAAGRYLDRRGDGGYMAMFQVDDLDAERARLQALGVRIVWQGEGEGIRGLHIHPADIGGAIVSLDQPTPSDSWGWAGTSWRADARDDVVRSIAGVEVQSAEPEGLARRWAEVLGVAPPGVRFAAAEDGRGEGIGGLDMVASDRNRAGQVVEVAGVRVRLV
jgi:catechol 2,3-dioxygenase-like lactoylglutathione lyase family enzyme